MDSQQKTNQSTEDNKPQRHVWRTVSWLVVAVFLGVAGLIVVWHVALGAPTSDEQYRPANPPVPLPAAYYGTVEGQIAQGLGLTPAQVRAGIVADPSEGLFAVATAHDVTPDGLYTLELAALQMASDQMTATGEWTQAQNDATMRYWRARGVKALGADMTDWYLHH